MADKEFNPLELSDDEIANAGSYEELKQRESSKASGQSEDKIADKGSNQSNEPVQEPEQDNSPAPQVEPQEDANKAVSEDSPDSGSKDKEPEPSKSVSEDEGVPDGKAQEPDVQGASSASDKTQESLDYEALYKKITAPFKANGKEITVKDPEDVIKLMQMGANYTRKMQEIAPLRKLKLTLENNGLLNNGVVDSNSLNFLLDLKNGNVEAIKKLLKDHKIESSSLMEDSFEDEDDKKQQPYIPNNYEASDQAVAFQGILDFIKTTPQGMDTIREMNLFDESSKGMLWQNPSLMTSLNEQMASGVYKRIKDGIEQAIMVGKLDPALPFITQYEMVGNAMLEDAKRRGLVQQSGSMRQPLTVQAASSKTTSSKLPNAQKAKAASPTKGTSSMASTPNKNYLNMSDEEFEKEFEKVRSLKGF